MLHFPGVAVICKTKTEQWHALTCTTVLIWDVFSVQVLAGVK